MTRINRIIYPLGLAVFTVAFLVLELGTGSQAGEKKAPLDIVDTAIDAGHFTTLMTTLDATGLDETLRQKGPYTVFAPLDEAFEKLPPGTLAKLLMDENMDTLKSILTLHVVPGKLTASQMRQQNSTLTVNGQRLSFATRKRALMVDNARVIRANIPCKNGIIHVIDRVILPRITLPEY